MPAVPVVAPAARHRSWGPVAAASRATAVAVAAVATVTGALAAGGALAAERLSGTAWGSSTPGAVAAGLLASAGAAVAALALRRQADGDPFAGDLAGSLDVASDAREAVAAFERALAAASPSARLLMPEESTGDAFARVSPGSTDGEGEGAIGCRAQTLGQCPAARRGVAMTFSGLSPMDTCPQLATGYSAACVPVRVAGRSFGVIHAPGRAGRPPSATQVRRLMAVGRLAAPHVWAAANNRVPPDPTAAVADELTGLLTRDAFGARLAAGLRSYPVVTVAMVAIDDFDRLNTNYGRDTGDLALRLMARALRESLRENDMICRYGGAQFALALPSCPAPSAAGAINAIRTRLDAAVTVSGLPIFTASFGAAPAGPDASSADAVAKALRALAAAKRQGGDSVVIENASRPTDGRAAPGSAVLRSRDFAEHLPPIVIDTTDTEDPDD